MTERYLERRGECLRCGKCCFISQSNPSGWSRLKASALGEGYKEGENQDKTAPVVIEDRCYQLHTENDESTACMDWTNRPPLCRAFPRNQHELIPGCGYWLVLFIDGEERKTYGDVRE